jgi:hypothetical protein
VIRGIPNRNGSEINGPVSLGVLAPAVQVTGIAIQIGQRQAVRFHLHRRSLLRRQKRVPLQSGQRIRGDCIRCKCLSRYVAQEPGPALARAGLGCLCQNLQLSAVVELKDVDARRDSTVGQTLHVDESQAIPKPEATLLLGAQIQGSGERCIAMPPGLLGQRWHDELGERENRDHQQHPCLEHRHTDVARRYPRCPHRDQLAAMIQNAQSDQASQQRGRRSERHETVRHGQTDEQECVDHPIVPLANVLELVHQL